MGFSKSLLSAALAVVAASACVPNDAPRDPRCTGQASGGLSGALTGCTLTAVNAGESLHYTFRFTIDLGGGAVREADVNLFTQGTPRSGSFDAAAFSEVAAELYVSPDGEELCSIASGFGDGVDHGAVSLTIHSVPVPDGSSYEWFSGSIDAQFANAPNGTFCPSPVRVVADFGPPR